MENDEQTKDVLPVVDETEPKGIAAAPLTRQAAIASFDETSRTALMTFSTGAQVRRFDFFLGEFFEEVSMSESAADLSRVESGAVPFLRNHGGWFGAGIEDVLGRVTDAKVDGERGEAKVLFSRRPENLPFVQDIKDGVLSSVSMGYLVQEMEKVGVRDEVPVLRATKWRLFEISSVAMPADANAQFRSIRGMVEGSEDVEFKCFPTAPCKLKGFSRSEIDAMRKRSGEFETIFDKFFDPVFEEAEEKKEVENNRELPEDQNTGEIQMTDAEKKALEEQKRQETEAVRKEAREAEATRQKEIRHAVRAAKLEESFAEDLIGDLDVTADKARSLVIEKLAESDKKTETRSIKIEAGDLEEGQTRREAMKEAILHRGNPEAFKVTERSREWAGLSLLEMARESLRRRNVPGVLKMTKSELAGRAFHSDSDFPEINADIVNKSLRQGFAAAPQTFSPFTRRVQNPDFKQISRVQLGHGSGLVSVPEGGEIQYGSMGEAAEKYSIAEYARGFSITRRALINDDLDAFVRIPASMGVRARQLESEQIWGVITANANMADGNALFSAAHGNVATGGDIDPPSTTTLGVARSAMRKQTDLDSQKLNLMLRWIAGPVELETVLEQLVSATLQPDSVSNVNPFAPGGRTPVQIITEPLLSDDSATRWYGFASLDQVDMVELATLSGSMEPEIMTEESFDVLGMKFRVVHSIGTKAIDWRGMYANDGT